MPQGLHDGIRFYGSSASSDSKESQSWVRVNCLQRRHQSTTDGPGIFLSSPSDLSRGPHWTPLATQESNTDEHETNRRGDSLVRQLPFTPTMEGSSRNVDIGSSFSSGSDSSGSERNMRPWLSSRCHFSSRRFFLSKPVHPMSFPSKARREASEPAVSGFSDFEATTPQRDGHSWSSASSSIDSVDVPEPLDSETSTRQCTPSDHFKCGLCNRFLSQRSPWSSSRIVRSDDMPNVGVLSCGHVFHAECLEQTTPKTRKNDPPCPICDRLTEENSQEQRVFSQIRNRFPRLKPFREDGPSRPWGCVQVGDCVEGALHAPPRNTMMLLSRSHVKKNLSLRGNSSKEFPSKSRKSGLHGKPINQSGKPGCSKAEERAPW